MTAFLLAIALDSSECMSIRMFYQLLMLGAREGDSIAIRFVTRVEDAFSVFKADPSLEVLLFQTGELCISIENMQDYMYKAYPLTTLVHPLPRIAWDKVAAAVSNCSPLETSMAGLEYNVPLAGAEETDDPDILLVRRCALTNFKVDRASFEQLQAGTLDQPIAVYMKETGSLTAKRPHTGRIADRCFRN